MPAISSSAQMNAITSDQRKMMSSSEAMAIERARGGDIGSASSTSAAPKNASTAIRKYEPSRFSRQTSMHRPSVSTGMTGYSSDFITNSDVGSEALTPA